MSKTLRIATWNANGLSQHIQDVEIFLNSEKIDICLISESHSTKTSYVKVHGYLCYSAVHPADRARGGSAIFVKENLQHYEILKVEEEYLQVIAIRIQANRYKEYSVGAIYCPPRYKLKREEFIQLFETLGGNFIIGGDFNAKHLYWGSRVINPKGKELLAARETLGCDFNSGGKPTYLSLIHI